MTSAPQTTNRHRYALPHRIQYGTVVSSHNPKHSDVGIFLNRRNRTYRPSELVDGSVCLTAKDGWSHQEINLRVLGDVSLKHPPRSKDVRRSSSTASFNSDAPSVATSSQTLPTQPALPNQTLIDKTILIKPAGRLRCGVHDLRFSFPLLETGAEPLLETYRGTYVTITYLLSVTVERGIFARTLEGRLEFVVRTPSLTEERPNGDAELSIDITPETVTGTKSVLPFPSSTVTSHPERPLASPGSKSLTFRLAGKLFRSRWSLDAPIEGEISVEDCSVPIRSVDVRLWRLESVSRGGLLHSAGGIAIADAAGTNGEATAAAAAAPTFDAAKSESHTQQIADGDLPRRTSVPVHMPVPRLVACPTVRTATFRIEFELEIGATLVDGAVVTKSYPITLYR